MVFMRTRPGRAGSTDAAPPAAPAPDDSSEGGSTTVASPPPRHQRYSPDRPRLGDLLISEQKVTPNQVAEALLQQSVSGKYLGTLLVELGALTERDLADTLAAQHGLSVIDLRQHGPEPGMPELLSESLARGLAAVPLRLEDDGTVVVAVGDPSAHVHEMLAEHLGRAVRMVVASHAEVLRVVDQAYRALADVDDQVAAFQATEATRLQARGRDDLEQAGQGADAPVVQVVNKIITQALRDRASDVHIEPQDDRVRVRFRIDGALHDVLALPAQMGPALTSRIKILAEMNIVERRRSQDGQIAMDVDGRDVDIRVATTGVHWGEKVVLRMLDKSRSLYRLSDLGMPADTHAAFSKLIRAPFGMVLCVGPTGAGKTTTLYASLSEVNESHRNVMTIEDPVEYVFPSINQIQTNEQAGITFASGLKSILRQDPDVILVGEIRDVDTARIAVQSALTGHFVLSSLHATDAVAALHRFLDMGVESFLIASSVIAVVGQRLVRRTCDYCKAPYEPTEEELAFYLEAGGKRKETFYAGTGCNLCSGTGYQDRIGVYEMLRVTPEIKRLVVGWAAHDELKRMAVAQGMRTLQHEALTLVENDVTTISEVVRAIYAY